ncbi:MAG TPA: CHASE2 domain-containing protein, partial [Phycisphaerae bacterium]
LLGPIDQRTDIWSLGVILFEIATGGGFPYKLDGLPGKSVTESLLHRIRHERPEPPRIGFPPYAAHLKTLIDACLAHEPDRRLSSAAALAADVRCVREGQRIGTARRSRIHSLERLAIGLVVNQPHALRVSGLAAVLTFLTVLTFSYGTSWRAATPQHSSAVSAKPVAIVGVGDSTAAHVMEFAGHAGLPGVTADIRTWRAVHGNVMRRLVAARPQVVVWDYYFESAQPSDADFVAGARELLGAGVPVVLAVHRYDEQGQPVLSPGIYQPLRGRVRHGAILARDMGSFIERRGEFVTALRHAERIYPSLALATLGAIRHPDGQLSLEWPLDPERRSKSMDVAASEWSPRDRQLTVRYARLDNSEEYLAGVDRVPISREIQATAAALAAQRGDLLACTSLDLQPPDVWRARTVPYESLLDSTDDNCVTGLSGRIVIIGDIRRSGAEEARDRHAVRYRDGSMQTVPGCFLLADAICGLSAQEYLVPVFPPTPLLITLIGVAVVLGLALTIPLVRFATFRRAFARRAALTGTVILAAICFHQVRRAEVATQGMLLMFGAALFTAAFAALLIELARARYRIPIATDTDE